MWDFSWVPYRRVRELIKSFVYGPKLEETLLILI